MGNSGDAIFRVRRMVAMKQIYVHVAEDEDIGFEGRSYRLAEEVLDYQGRKVLYLKSEASAVSFCDRSYACHLGSINVKGYVVRWKYGTDEKGEMLSEIEPINNEMEEQEISRLLRANHCGSAVHFF